MEYGLSSPAMRFKDSLPHFKHSWTIANSPLDFVVSPIGFILAWHIERRSPGVFRSTCFDQRHNGQWLR